MSYWLLLLAFKKSYMQSGFIARPCTVLRVTAIKRLRFQQLEG